MWKSKTCHPIGLASPLRSRVHWVQYLDAPFRLRLWYAQHYFHRLHDSKALSYGRGCRRVCLCPRRPILAALLVTVLIGYDNQWQDTYCEPRTMVVLMFS